MGDELLPAFKWDSALPTTWQVPQEVLRAGFRREPQFAYLALWNYRECKPGLLLLDLLAFKTAFRASERAVRRWLTTLNDHGFIDILELSGRIAKLRIRDFRTPREREWGERATVGIWEGRRRPRSSSAVASISPDDAG